MILLQYIQSVLVVFVGVQVHIYTTAKDGDSEQYPLYVLSILPQFEDTTGLDVQIRKELSTLMLAAGQLAESSINNATNVLPGHTLNLINGDSGCSADKPDDVISTLPKELFYSPASESRNVVGIVGPTCSETTLKLSYQIPMPEISLAAVTISDSLELSNRMLYSNTFSTVTSSRIIVDALITLMKTKSWNNVAIIYDGSEEYYKTLFRELDTEIQKDSSLQSFPSVLFDQFSLIRFDVPSFVRIFFLLANPMFVQRVLCLASVYDEVNIEYPNYQFVIVSDISDVIVNRVPSPFKYNRDTITCTDIARVWNQSILLIYHLEPQNTTLVSDTGLLYEDFTQELSQVSGLSNASRSGIYYAAAYYDAIWSIAFALNSSASYFNLSEYTYGQVNNTELFKQQLEMLEFVGVSGVINFNKTTGFTDRNLDIFQVRDNIPLLLEYYDNSTGRIELYTNESVDYINGNFDQYLYASKSVGILWIVVFLIIGVLLIFIQVLNVTHAEYPSIKASSPKLAHFAFAGCYIMIVGVLVFIIGEVFDVSGGNKCQYYHGYRCLLFIGWTAVFATLCARSFRIYRIFVHYINPGRFISNLYLTSFIVGVILLAILFTIGWSVYAGVKNLPTPQMILATLRNGQPVIWIQCNVDDEHYSFWLLFADIYSLTFVLAACILASLSIGKVKLRNFELFFVVVLCCVLLILTISLELLDPILRGNKGIVSLAELTEGNVETDIFLVTYCTAQFISMVLCLSLLFIPPVSPLLRDKYKEYVKPKVTSWLKTL